MKIKFLVLLTLCFSIFSCNDSKKVPDEIATTYYGILPCADCPGIYYELKLNQDFTYSEKRFYLESEVDTMTEKGTFQIKNDSLIILKNTAKEGGVDKLKITNGNLKFLDANGKDIDSPLKEFYILKTTKPKELPLVKSTETRQSFKATGTEPFWSLDIDPKKNILSFKEMEGTVISVSIPKPEVTDSTLVYSANSEQRILEVSILEASCQNDMSGEMFTHIVFITFKTPEMDEAKTYKGCGEYAVVKKEAQMLTGKWVLESINGTTVGEGTKFKAPTLQFDLKENRVNGNSGCNQYFGSFKLLEANKIEFQQMGSTKMACHEPDKEMEYLQAISTQNLSYSVKDGKLTLSTTDVSLIFKKLNETVE